MMSMSRGRTPREPDSVMIKNCAEAGLAALRQVQKMPAKLGDRGRKVVSDNQFGDRQIIADVECERAVIDTFQQYDLPLRLMAEEHGNTNLHQFPRLLLLLDGLDGSASFVGRAPAGSHGTLFSVYSSLEPSYGDYICAGMADFRTGRLYLAVRGQGLVMHDGPRTSKVEMSSIAFPRRSQRVSGSIPASGGVYGERLRALDPLDYYSWVEALRRMFDGECYGIVESTRKGNLEQAALYPLVREAGGSVIALDGSDLGIKNFLTFGQAQVEGLIAASSAQAAELLRQKLVG